MCATQLEQVARDKARVGGQAIEFGIGRRPLHQDLTALDAQHLTRFRGQRQREVAEAAKPVDHAFVGSHIEQAQRAPDQRVVDVRVDLGEVSRLERHRDAELGQRIGQCIAALVQALHSLRPLGLQPPLHAVFSGKIAQALQVRSAEWLEMAQHQGHRHVTDGELDLRQAVAPVHRHYQGSQGQQQGTHVRRQHAAALHIGDEARLALVKANQHAALLDHMAYRQPGAVAVAPGRALDRTQHERRLDLAQVPQTVFERALLDRDLRSRVQVLHLAAATGAGVQAEMRAGRAHPLRTLALQCRQRGLLPLLLAPVDAHLHRLARQRALDEYDLAFAVMGHALRFEVERLDLQPLVVCRHTPDYPGRSQPSRLRRRSRGRCRGAPYGASA